MWELIKLELKRFSSKKYILIMMILLIALNVYIIDYDYDNFLNYKYLEENINEALVHIEGNITENKTRRVKEEHKKVLQALEQDYETEEEAYMVNLHRLFYSDYLDYIDESPFPVEYLGEVYANKTELLTALEKHKDDPAVYVPLSEYLSLIEKINKDNYYVMHWAEVFEQNSLLFLMVTIIISMATIFGEDYSGNGASLILSSKYGKTKLVKARILAGTIFSSVIFLLFYGVELLYKLWLHGINGYQGNVSILGFIFIPFS